MQAHQQGHHMGGAAPLEQQTLWVDNALRVPFDPQYQMKCICAQFSHACQQVLDEFEATSAQNQCLVDQ